MENKSSIDNTLAMISKEELKLSISIGFCHLSAPSPSKVGSPLTSLTDVKMNREESRLELFGGMKVSSGNHTESTLNT